MCPCLAWNYLQNLLRGEPLKLVDGGKSQRTFLYIKDAIEAVLLMIVWPTSALPSPAFTPGECKTLRSSDPGQEYMQPYRGPLAVHQRSYDLSSGWRHQPTAPDCCLSCLA